MRGTIGCAALLSVLLLGPAPAAAQQDNPFSSCQPNDPTRFLGNRREPITERPGATRTTLTGPVEVVCNEMRLFADQLVHEDDTDMIFATGNVSMHQPDLEIFAERAEINGRTKLGTFYNASGTARIGGAPTQRNQFGTQEPDVMFHGDVIARIGPTTYTIRNGGFTTCVQPTNRWEMSGANGTIKLDRYALLRHVVLRVKDVPLLYLPAIYYPINKEDRATGFLLPTYGASTMQGGSISNAFFWAMGRSHDATFYHDWYTKTGHGFGSEYRYMTAPGSQGRANFLMTSRRDIGMGGVVDPEAPTKRSFQLDGDISQAIAGGFRLMANANYFTDITTQQLYQNLTNYSHRTRSFRVALSGTVGRVRLSTMADQRDYFYGLQPGQRIGRAPSINVALSDTPIGRSRVYYGASGEAAYLIRQYDVEDPTTNTSLWRFDGGPSIRAPLSSLPYLTATGSASWRITRWQETRDPVTEMNVPIAMTRQLFDLRAQIVGPVLARVFQTPDNGYATGFKHLIEPSFSIQRTMPFLDIERSDRIVKNDYAVDYLVGGVTTINYRLTNRLLARRPSPGAAPGSAASLGVAREILSVEIGQSYYSDARQAQSDSQYQYGGVPSTQTGGTFSPLQLSAVTRPTDTASGDFRVQFDSKHRKVRMFSASTTIHAALAQVTGEWSRRLAIPGLPGFSESTATHDLSAATTIRTRDNRIGGTYTFNYDAKRGALWQQRIMAYLNSQCCGVSFDWQTISMPMWGIQADRRFGISFTLAGIGSFSNPLGSFGGR